MTGRPFVGTMLILLWIAVYSLVVIVLFDFVLRWPVPVQGLFFLVAGIAWIAPLKPLLRWIETGRFGR
ncbi:DUF2842 domain-containing protein [Sphingomonas sp. ASV193]|uniref:DUF2842 domain-containing protein n=1 Tax=Sphingomonas sp. ASV193 TaxID=3144405 RepID=UPI0032E87BC0